MQIYALAAAGRSQHGGKNEAGFHKGDAGIIHASLFWFRVPWSSFLKVSDGVALFEMER